jgi:hypothetical protein
MTTPDNDAYKSTQSGEVPPLAIAVSAAVS